MFLIGATILLLLVVFISGPAIRLISRPLNANFPLAARIVRASLWVVILCVATWPLGIEPLLFKLNCSYFTKFQVEPVVDARVTGYLDDRLGAPENNMDSLYLNFDVEDLVSGRIAFFEMKRIRNGSTDETLMPYLRYSLMELGSPKCSPRVFGFADGQGLLVTGAPGKCVVIESVDSPLSRYLVRASGNINQADGTTKILERSTDKVVAIFRSFYFSFFGSGSYCPRINVDGAMYNAHLELTRMIFMDVKGAVKKAIFPK